MNKSESIKNLSEALVTAQAEMPVVEFNKTNPFLKNKYADLGAVIKTAQPILAKNGLAVSQLCTTEGDQVGVETMLMHKSGEWISSSMSISLGEERGKSTAQVAGSIVTYIRRYALAAMLGMYADEDGDGNGEGTGNNGHKAQTKTAPDHEGKWIDEAIEKATPKAMDNKQFDFQTRPYDPETLKAALAKKVEKIGTYSASDKQRNFLGSLLNEFYQDDTKRHEASEWLLGNASTKEIDGAMVKAALDWLNPTKDDGGAYQIDATAKTELSQVLPVALEAAGQEALL